MTFWKNIHIFVTNFLNSLFCNQLIISAFMSSDVYTLSARDFLPAVFGSVRPLSLLLNPRMQEKTLVHQPGICHNCFLYLLQRPSEAVVTLSLDNIL